jgi:5-methylcytosine-specific restriction protein A
MIRNPTWKRDELILALDLYFRHPPSHIGKTHAAVVSLHTTSDRP